MKKLLIIILASLSLLSCGDLHLNSMPGIEGTWTINSNVIGIISYTFYEDDTYSISRASGETRTIGTGFYDIDYDSLYLVQDTENGFAIEEIDYQYYYEIRNDSLFLEGSDGFVLGLERDEY